MDVEQRINVGKGTALFAVATLAGVSLVGYFLWYLYSVARAELLFGSDSPLVANLETHAVWTFLIGGGLTILLGLGANRTLQDARKPAGSRSATSKQPLPTATMEAIQKGVICGEQMDGSDTPCGLSNGHRGRHGPALEAS